MQSSTLVFQISVTGKINFFVFKIKDFYDNIYCFQNSKCHIIVLNFVIKLEVVLILFNQQTHNILDADTFLTVTLLHVSMPKYHPHQRIPLYTKVTKTIKIKSTVIYGCHNKVKKLKTSRSTIQQSGYNS